MNITVRRATLKDAPSLSKLCKLLGFEGDDRQMIERISDINSYEYHRLLVSEDEKQRVTGFVHFFIAPTLLTLKTIEIGGLAVLEDFQKIGFGKALMKAVEEWSITQGCESILLATNEAREDAIKFYEKIGYQKEFKTYFMRKHIDAS